MASGIINGTTANKYIDSKIEWSSVLSPGENLSSVSVTLFYKRNNSGYVTSGNGTFKITVDGTTTSTSKYIEITENEWIAAASSRVTVKHDSDGSKQILISAEGMIPDTSLSYTECGGKVSLDVNDRGSTFALNTGFTTEAGTPYVVVDNVCTIGVTINRKSSDFKHTVNFFFREILIESYQGITNSIVLCLHMDKWLTHMRSSQNTLYLSDALAPSVEVLTYDAEGNLIATSERKRFDIAVLKKLVLPQVTAAVMPVSSLTGALSNLYIQGKTSIKTSFEEAYEYGAVASRYVLAIPSENYMLSVGLPYNMAQMKALIESEEIPLTKSGASTINITVFDSRGFSATASNKINVLAYSPPRIAPYSGLSSIECIRCLADGTNSRRGTYLRIKASRVYSRLTNEGVEHNHCLIRFRYRESDSSNYSAWETILPKSQTSTDNIDVITLGHYFAVDKSYVIQVGVVDDLGETNEVEVPVSADAVTIHLARGGKRIGVLGWANTDDDSPGIDVFAPIYGGSVDSLALGNMINASEDNIVDMNEITEPNCYYVPDDRVTYITNAPFSTGYTFKVRQTISRLVQVATDSNLDTKIRYQTDGTPWSSWTDATTMF